MFIIIALLFSFAVLGQCDQCFDKRRECWDENYGATSNTFGCNAASNYINCISIVYQNAFCSGDEFYNRKAWYQFRECGNTKSGGAPWQFPELDATHEGLDQIEKDDMRYEFAIDKSYTFDEAETFCWSSGGSLVNIRSQDDLSTIRDSLQDLGAGDVWVGLSDAAEEGDYRWRDGSKTDWVAWNAGEGPNRSGFLAGVRSRGRDCVKMSGGWWYDVDCSERHPFVCEYRGNPTYDQ